MVTDSMGDSEHLDEYQARAIEELLAVREGSGETPQWQWQRSKNEREGLFLAPARSIGRC